RRCVVSCDCSNSVLFMMISVSLDCMLVSLQRQIAQGNGFILAMLVSFAYQHPGYARMARLPLNTLSAFRTVAELQHLRAAADVLHLTHSAVSQQIRGLEDQLGFDL